MHVSYTQHCEAVVQDLTDRLVKEGKAVSTDDACDGDTPFVRWANEDLHREREQKEVELEHLLHVKDTHLLVVKDKLKRVTIANMWRNVTRNTLSARLQEQLQSTEAQVR